jgi:chromosome segregation ATPase
MEKTVRKLRQDIREKDAEIAKFKESKEQQDKLISSLEDSIKKKDLDLSNSQKNTIAIQAVSAASAEKILRLEAEIVDKTNEFAGQRRALENSYAECNELKKVLADLRCEKEELQRELGQGATRVVETESTRRDLEHREAILRATNKQLQDSLQRQMAEAVGREERMREELLDTRKRWQDAVTTREALASEMAVATTPLLRQISSLQESIRIKGDNWQKIESTLSERALRAEHLADAAENRKLFLEDQNASLKQQLNAQNSTIEELRIANDALTVSIDKLNTEISSNQKMILNLQDTYAKECTAKKEMEERLNNLDTHCKKAILEANDAASIISKRCDSQIHSLQSTIDSLTRELEIEKSKRGKEDSSLPQYNTRKIEFVSRDTRYENNVTGVDIYILSHLRTC